MWLIIICVSSFAVGLLSFKASFRRRIWIDILTPLIATIVVVLVPALMTSEGYDRLWRLISIVPGIGCGIVAAFLSEIPIAMLSKRRGTRDLPDK
jgi:hypothetical protein